MIINYTVIQSNTGEIIKSGACLQDDITKQAVDGQTAVEGQWHDAVYFWDLDAQEFVLRPEMNLTISATTIGVDETLSITGIPEGTALQYVGGQETIDDGELEWSSNVAGAYLFILTNFPYQERVVQIEVTA
tara:strand:- start:242 stop:637 length:396 start_codon:yes stop_codon:yes gene_type:complete